VLGFKRDPFHVGLTPSFQLFHQVGEVLLLQSKHFDHQVIVMVRRGSGLGLVSSHLPVGFGASLPKGVKFPLPGFGLVYLTVKGYPAAPLGVGLLAIVMVVVLTGGGAGHLPG
jgi:hypothetical protein